jgi:hypothetical protein
MDRWLFFTTTLHIALTSIIVVQPTSNYWYNSPGITMRKGGFYELLLDRITFLDFSRCISHIIYLFSNQTILDFHVGEWTTHSPNLFLFQWLPNFAMGKIYSFDTFDIGLTVFRQEEKVFFKLSSQKRGVLIV